MDMKPEITHVVGIDEAGRGPLAGPVAVGVVCLPRGFRWSLIKGVKDSKMLSERKRELLYEQALELRKRGALDFTVALVGPQIIDRVGITRAVRIGIRRGLGRLFIDPRVVQVKLDGLLSAPDTFIYQETIVKGDQRLRVIGLASILAKVTRDRHMRRMAKMHPQYGFEVHKGYGTRSHRASIEEYGFTDIHRRTFCLGA